MLVSGPAHDWEEWYLEKTESDKLVHSPFLGERKDVAGRERLLTAFKHTTSLSLH